MDTNIQVFCLDIPILVYTWTHTSVYLDTPTLLMYTCIHSIVYTRKVYASVYLDTY